MKRRSNNDDRAQLEQEAMAELARQAGPPPSRPSMRQSRAGAPPAWGVGPTPSAAPAPEPAWKRRERALPEPEWEADEADEGEEEWEEDGWEDDVDGDEPIGLLGVPLDYDATGIALQQLAERSNIRRPVSSVSGIDPTDAERFRDRALAQFLDGQKVRARQDAELAAAREAANPKPKAPTKRAAYPPLSPGLSAKSLVMQPVAAPPLNRPLSADERSTATKAPAARAGAAGPNKTGTKKAVTKKAGAAKAGAAKAGAAKAGAAKAPAPRAAAKAAAAQTDAARPRAARPGPAKASAAKVGVAEAATASSRSGSRGTRAGTARGPVTPVAEKAAAEKAVAKTVVAEKAVAETVAAGGAANARPTARGARKAVTRRAVVEAPAPESTEVSEAQDIVAAPAQAPEPARRSLGTRRKAPTARTSAADRSKDAFDEAAREMAAAGAPPPIMDDADGAETSAPGPAPKPGRSRIGTRARRRQA